MKANTKTPLDSMEVHEISPDFIEAILKPYRNSASYLKKATFYYDKEKGLDGLLIKGEFAINESCYIDDTGHFNAVEYNICYNQLGYIFFGHCIKNKLMPELSDYTLEYFFEHQLPNFLILKIASSFSSILNPKLFQGTWGIQSSKKTSKLTFLQTYCDFEDGSGGAAKGEVTLGVLSALTIE